LWKYNRKLSPIIKIRNCDNHHITKKREKLLSLPRSTKEAQMATQNSKLILIIIIMLSIASGKVYAQTTISCIGSSPTWTAKDCSQSAVQACINAANKRDTINVPPGASCVWSSPILLNKEIKIIGAGKGVTNIVGPAFTVADGTNNWRISGFTFTDPGNVTTALQVGATRSSKGCNCFRIDNCEFNGYAHWIEIDGRSTGVMDDNHFQKVRSSGIYIFGEDEPVWAKDTSLGTGEFVFVENNTFETAGVPTAHFILSNWGSKLVVRNNIMKETGGASCDAWIDMHGYCHGNTVTGTRAFEIYKNTFIRNTNGCCRAIFLRGGTGVVYDNIFDESAGKFLQSGSHNAIELVEYRAAMIAGTSSTCDSACSTSAWCASAAENLQRHCIEQNSPYTATGWPCSSDADCKLNGGNGICSPYGEGWPCCGQIGIGKNNKSEPVYFWNNKDQNGQDIPIVVGTGSDSHIKKDRDFFISVKPNYKSFRPRHPLADPSAPKVLCN
jgi:hypothetical protein